MKKQILFLAVAGLLTCGSVSAKPYRATNWLQPIHTLNAEPYQRFAKELKDVTDGSISFTVFSGGTLVPAKATMQALRDNTAQLGIVYPGYTPAELPYNNVLVDLGFLVEDPMAAAFAYTEINLRNPKLIAEWNSQKVIFAGGYSTPIYNFMCVKPIRTLEDVKGKKIRTAGGTQTDWVTSIGGVPVSVPIGDVYTGLARGSVDCTMAEVPNLINSKFIEVVSSITRLDMGAVPGAIYVMNPTFWSSLSPEDQQQMISAMAQGLADQQIGYASRTVEALADAKERIEIIEPGSDLTSKLDSFRTEYIKELPEKSIKTRNIDDPTDVIDSYAELEIKWRELLDEIDRTDRKAVHELLMREIYSKIDTTKFILN